jgi:HD-GYP domain-containing protein (c-di-GMP phosphodiesterase class II)
MKIQQHKKHRFIKLIRFWGVVFLAALAAVIISIDLAISYHELGTHIDETRASYVEQQKQATKREVERVVNLINHERTQAEILTRAKIKTRVDEARAIAENIYQKNKTTKSDPEIQKIIIDALRPIRFENGNGYYFIIGFDGVGLLLPDRPEKEGSNLLSQQDSHGQYIVKDTIRIARNSGEGFYKYHWTKPRSTGNEFKKLSYIKRFEPYNWFLGTGLYVDDIEEQLKIKWMERINSIRYGNNQVGYIFAADWQGNSLAHGAQPDLIGQNGWEWEDSRGNKTSQLLIAASKKPEGDFVNFWWRKPDTGKESAKIAYAKAVPEWQLFIGSGVYVEDIEQSILSLQNALNAQEQTKIIIFITVVSIAFILFFIAFHFLSNQLKKDLSFFGSFIEQMAFSDKKIDRGTIRFAELDEMAESANKMIIERKKNEESLRNRTQELDLSREETIHRLAKAAEFRDNETAEHNQRMSHYCKLLAERIGMSTERCEKIRLASVMHDIGKIGISDLVLLKPGKLTNDELSTIKSHPEIGYRILSGSSSPLLDLGAIIALTHHEKYDGSGYPHQIAGEDIPIEGRIAAIADVFDALTSSRVYREAWSIDRTLKLLVKEKGAHFDPLLVNLFLESIDDVIGIRELHADGSAVAMGSIKL